MSFTQRLVNWFQRFVFVKTREMIHLKMDSVGSDESSFWDDLCSGSIAVSFREGFGERLL